MGGSSQPAVRAEVNPLLLSKLGIGLDQVRTALNAANADVPKGALVGRRTHMYLLNDNDQLFLRQGICPADRCLSQRSAGAACPMWPRWSIARRTSATPDS